MSLNKQMNGSNREGLLVGWGGVAHGVQHRALGFAKVNHGFFEFDNQILAIVLYLNLIPIFNGNVTIPEKCAKIIENW